MNISWHGLSCIKISTKSTENETTLLVDPFIKQGNTKIPKVSADIVLVTQSDSELHNNTKEVSGSPIVFDLPGEYESKNVLIRSVNSGVGSISKTLMSITSEGMTVAVITSLDKELSEAQLEQVGQVDILIIAIGDKKECTYEVAIKVARQLEPRIIIPIHYHQAGFKTKLDKPDEFIKKIDMEPEKAVEKFRISKKDLPVDETRLVLLGG